MADVFTRLHGPPPRIGLALPLGRRRLMGVLDRAEIGPEEWLRLLAWPLTSVVLASVIVVGSEPIVGALVLFAGAAAPIVIVVRRRHRRRDRLLAALPATLDHVARLLRAGLTPREALERTANRVEGPFAARLQAVVAALRLGSEPELATATLRRRGDPRSVAAIAVVIRIALSDAGGAADAIDALATTLRRDAALDARARSLTTQARLSATVLALLPAAFVGVGLLVGSEPAQTLATTTVGRAFALVGAALLGVGFGWMHLLIRRIER